jgi:tryptophan synthase alpha chain
MLKRFKDLKKNFCEGLTKIEEKFLKLKKNKGKALIFFLTYSFPNLKAFNELVQLFSDEQVDILEIGLPFSDPLADGITIQFANEMVLKNKFSLNSMFENVSKLTTKINLPFVLMTYYNPVYIFGLSKFVKSCKKTKISGIIVPDLPGEESKDLFNLLKKNNLCFIPLIAPTSTHIRVKKILNFSSGFVYCVSREGTTGAREKFPPYIRKYLLSIKKISNIPTVVGFGISKPQHIREVYKLTDGVVVGSVVIDIIKKNMYNKKEMFKEMKSFIKNLKKVCKGG